METKTKLLNYIGISYLLSVVCDGQGVIPEVFLVNRN